MVAQAGSSATTHHPEQRETDCSTADEVKGESHKGETETGIHESAVGLAARIRLTSVRLLADDEDLSTCQEDENRLPMPCGPQQSPWVTIVTGTHLRSSDCRAMAGGTTSRRES